MLIRQAQMTDAAAIAGVHIGSWRTTYAGILPQEHLDSLSHERRTAAWQTILSDTPSLWFHYAVEDDAGNIVGFSSAGPERSGNSIYTGELGGIYLLKSYQRQGIGRQIMVKVTNQLESNGHHSMMLWVLAQNPSRGFYEALSGQVIGEEGINIGGANLVKIAYGWKDIGLLARLLPDKPLA